MGVLSLGGHTLSAATVIQTHGGCARSHGISSACSHYVIKFYCQSNREWQESQEFGESSSFLDIFLLLIIRREENYHHSSTKTTGRALQTLATGKSRAFCRFCQDCDDLIIRWLYPEWLEFVVFREFSSF